MSRPETSFPRRAAAALGAALATLAEDLASTIWPRVCESCGEPSREPVCEACRAAVSFRRPARDCAVCGKTILVSDGAAGTAAPVCRNCRERRPAFDAARSTADYAGPVREIVQALKYRRAAGAAPWMARLMLGTVAANWPDERFDAVVPVPLHPSRERGRGYNQAALVAAGISAGLGVPLDARLLRRVRTTGTQTRLGAGDRRENVAGAFAVSRGRETSVFGKRFLVVDDVMTTGATLGAASAALRAAGAARILALSFARG